MDNALQINTNLTYCSTTLVVSQPLTFKNVSNWFIAFKIKTNKKNLISMNPCNGILKPNQSVSIPVKIVQKFDQSLKIKLQIDWCRVPSEMKQNQDDIKNIFKNQQKVSKMIFPIKKQVSNTQIKQNQEKSNQINILEAIIDINQSLNISKYSDSHNDQKKQLMLELQKKDLEEKFKNFKDTNKKIEESTQNVLFYKSTNQTPDFASSPIKNLQIVSQEDQEDYEKELEQIRNQQIHEKRLIDELESKIRKINQQAKSIELIEPKLLFLALGLSFLIGNFLQYLLL